MGRIHDVKIKGIVTHADDRGYLREVLRDDDEMLTRWAQTTVSKAFPGVIKAFHWHKKQDDLWYFVTGNARIILYDRRRDSPTFGETQVIPAGDHNPVTVLIPAGVAHGYQVLGHEPAMLMYHTTRMYDPASPDEERIPYNDPEIGFDWAMQHR